MNGFVVSAKCQVDHNVFDIGMLYLYLRDMEQLPIIGKKLVIRTMLQEDAKALFDFRSNERVNQYIERQSYVRMEEAEEFLTALPARMEKGECIILGIYVDENTRLVGSVCLFNFNEDHSIGELGYELHPTYQGKGIMVEALELFLAWIKKQSIVQKLTACIHEENEASSKLIKKLGFLPDSGVTKVPKDFKGWSKTL